MSGSPSAAPTNSTEYPDEPIATLVRDFQQAPHSFFCERELHAHFYCVARDAFPCWETIERVARGGPNAIFLMEDHTFEHFMQAIFLPVLLDRSRYDLWEQGGARDLYQRCNVEVKRILSEHETVPKPDDVLKGIADILQRA